MSSVNPAAEAFGAATTEQACGLAMTAGAEPDDRRGGPRREGDYWASLLSLDGREVISCQLNNMCEGGLHFTAPVGYGFAVGQRYELLVGERDVAGLDHKLVGEGHYATIVRTEFLIGDQGDQVGVGLRFDQPIVL